MRNFMIFVLGTAGMDVVRITHLPIQTEGPEAEARRARRAEAVKACIEKLGKDYRLHPRVQHGTHRLIDPDAKPATVHPLKLRKGAR